VHLPTWNSTASPLRAFTATYGLAQSLYPELSRPTGEGRFGKICSSKRAPGMPGMDMGHTRVRAVPVTRAARLDRIERRRGWLAGKPGSAGSSVQGRSGKNQPGHPPSRRPPPRHSSTCGGRAANDTFSRRSRGTDQEQSHQDAQTAACGLPCSHEYCGVAVAPVGSPLLVEEIVKVGFVKLRHDGPMTCLARDCRTARWV
jgi:hypothetical protein